MHGSLGFGVGYRHHRYPEHKIVDMGVRNAKFAGFELVIDGAAKVKAGKFILCHALDIFLLVIMAGSL